METAAINVGDQWRHDQGDQQIPDERPADADRVGSVSGCHLQTRHVLPRSESPQPHRQHADAQPGEQLRRGKAGRQQVSLDKEQCQTTGDQPVDQQRQQPS